MPNQNDLAAAAKADALRTALAFGLGGATVGIAQRVIPEAAGWFGRMNEPYVEGQEGSPLSIEVSPEGIPKRKPKKKPKPLLDRISAGTSSLIPSGLKTAGAWDQAVSGLNQTGTSAPSPHGSDTMNFLAGNEATTPFGVPWLAAALPVAVAGGYYGGRGLADSVLKPARKNEIENEVEIARKEYEQELANALQAPAKPKRRKIANQPASDTDHLDTLIGKFAEANGRLPTEAEMYKMGSTGILGQALDLPYNAAKAIVGPDALGALAQIPALGLGLGATGGAMLGWNYADSQNRAMDLAKKMRERKLMALMGETPPMYAVPVFDEEEEKKKPLPKPKATAKVS